MASTASTVPDTASGLLVTARDCRVRFMSLFRGRFP